MRATYVTLSVAVLAFGLDQASKYGIVTGLDLANRLAIDVVPPLLNFRMGWNEGINFGLLSGMPEIMRWALVLIAIGVAVWALFWASTKPQGLVHLSAGLLAGGALGNAYDRVLYGAVRDFLNMSCCGIRNPYVFNVADVCVFLGVAGLIYLLEIKKV
ncbi:MAG: signal peptidase II [Pseudomonadota bacterium]